MRYLNPKADLTFKKVFGEHPDLVRSLLNALLPFETPEEEISEVEYLPAELVPDTPLKKNSIVDVRCKDRRGRQFIVEMQMLWSPAFMQRVLLSYYHDYRIVCMEKTDRVIDGLRFVFVELPKFKPQTFSQKKMHVLWLRYLTEIDENTREIPQELMDNPEIKKAVTQIQESAFSDAQLLGYDDFWDAVRVEKTIVSDAERKGMAQAEVKWRTEEKRDIARNLKSLGLATEQIQAATGLTAEEIENL